MYYLRQRICSHLLQWTNRNRHCIPSTRTISQTTSGTRSLTHGQTLPMTSEWQDNTRHSSSMWLRKNTVFIVKISQKKNKKQEEWMQMNDTSPTSYYNRVGGIISNWRVTYTTTTILGMKDTWKLGRILCIFWPSTPSRPSQEIVNHKENTFPIKPLMEEIPKNMTRPTVKIKSAIIVKKRPSIFSLSKK